MMHGKGIRALVIGAILLLVSLTPAFASTSANALGVSATFLINGKLFSKQQVNPLVDDQGRVLVPLRFVVEALGAEVTWSGDIGLLQVRSGGNHLAILKGSQRVFVNGKIELIENPLYYYEPQRVNYVPLRFIGTYCGGVVAYQQDPVSKSISIRIDNPSPEVNAGTGLPSVDRGDVRPSVSTSELLGLLTPELPRLGSALSTLQAQMGSPLRTDLNSYGDAVAIYSLQGHYRYMSYRQNQVMSWLVFGSQWRFGALEAGQTWAAVTAAFPFQEEQQLTIGKADYTLKQDVRDMGRKLMLVQGDVILECFFDGTTDSLVAVRCSRPEAVIATKAYGMSCKFYGSKPTISLPILSPSEQQKRDLSATNQIIELTNCFRQMKGLKPLKVSHLAEAIALSHSRDMLNHGFVGHTSPYSGSLKQRYSAQSSQLQALSENIAFGSFEAMEAVHSWVNSPGHRDNLLGSIYTHIGVGTAKDYYTQNYIRFR